MGYDWEQHKETVRRLYLEESKTLDEAMRRLETTYGFKPSKRSFQTQIKKWGFLKSQNPPTNDVGEVVRWLGEFWKKNMSRPQMHAALEKKGFQISLHDVSNLCAANGLSIYARTRTRSKSSHSGASKPPSLVDSKAALSRDDSISSPEVFSVLSPVFSVASIADTDDTQRQNRFKRDASGAKVGFCSDTPVSAAKRKPGLCKREYQRIRNAFTSICYTMGIRSKADDPEKWEEAKITLRHQQPRLCAELWTPKADLEMKHKALDAICKHIAKSMRDMVSKMTQKEAKNALGLNPIEAGEARDVLSDLLEEAGFANKFTATPTNEQWKKLKNHWGGQCAKIRKALHETKAHPDDMGGYIGRFPRKRKALDALSRDILKRLRYQRPNRQPTRQQLVPKSLRSGQPRFDGPETRTRVDDLGDQLRVNGPEIQPRVHNAHIQPRIDDAEYQCYINQLAQLPLAGTYLGDFLPMDMDALADIPESSYTPQTMSSPVSGTITPYPPVGPPFGPPIFPLQPQQAVNRRRSCLALHAGSHVPYPPPPLTNTDASFLDAHHAPQAYGNTSFSAQTMPEWWPPTFGDARRPF